MDIAISVEKYLNMLQAGHNELRAHGKAVAAYRFFATFLHFVLQPAKTSLHCLKAFYTLNQMLTINRVLI